MKDFLEMLSELHTTNSTNNKKEILNKYALDNNQEVYKILYYTLNPFYKYWVTVEKINSYWELKWIGIEYSFIYLLLDDLRTRKITWHTAIESIILFLNNNKVSSEEVNVLKIILNKDLNVNVWVSIINKVFLNWWGTGLK